MLIALVVVIAIFALLLMLRLAGARRVALIERWPSVVLGLGAALALARGQIWFALGLAGAAALVWFFVPPARAGRAPPAANPEDEAARRILGVKSGASAEEIRAAYRAKMARAHPDRGGSHAEAAKLTAARDRLLKR